MRQNLWFKIVLSAVFVYVIIFTFMGISLPLGIIDKARSSYGFTMIMEVFLSVIIIFALRYYMKKMDKKSLRDFGVYMARKDLLFILIVLVATLLLCFIFVFVTASRGLVDAKLHLAIFASPTFYGILVTSVIAKMLAAFHEEMLSRGYFMFHLRKYHVITVILVSSLLFAMIHIPMKGADPWKMISWLLGGITYAYMYMKSGNLVVPTLAHAIHNMTSDFMIYSHSGFSLFELSSSIGDDMKLWFKVPLALVLVLLTMLFYGKNGLLTPAPSIKKLWGTR